jgi:5-methylcytosine-specific restriction protein A
MRQGQPDWPYNTDTWQRLRRVKLQETPLCEPCSALGRLEPATVVDHRVPISAGGSPFPALDELNSMCVSCHNRKTQGEQQGNATFIMKGADVRGLPVDPAHPFFGDSGVTPSNHERLQVPRRAASRKITNFKRLDRKT